MGVADLPLGAREGPYAIGKMIMVSRDSLTEDFRLLGLNKWFPARVAMPPSGDANRFRWYDPFIWYQAESEIHVPTDVYPLDMGYVGLLWNPRDRNNRDKWAYPIKEWLRLFAGIESGES